MSARRTSHGEPKSAVPFNQYLPNKSNQTAYVPAPLRKKKVEREEYRKSWSTATSPLVGRGPSGKAWAVLLLSRLVIQELRPLDVKEPQAPL